jgi:ATP-dependent Clp protease protease subunit
MNESSLLMIHNAWTCAAGNAEELRKQADDLEKITQASVEAYKAHSSLTEEEIKALMDNETWILPEEALEYGFATSIAKTENANAKQNAFLQLFEIIKAHQQEEEVPEEEVKEAEDETEEPEEPETEEPETEDEGETDEEEQEETEEKVENAAQKMGGFFNAILKM